MSAILAITFPIFAIIGIGYAFVRLGLMRQDQLGALASFTMNLALPSLLFSAVTAQGNAIDWGYLGLYAGGTVTVAAAAYAWFRLTGLTLARAGVATLGCTLSNSGFVGYPILLLALPAVAKQAFAMNVLVENIVVLPLSLVLMSLDASGNAEGRWQAMWRILLSTLRRPLILALLIGLPVKLSGLALPLPVTRLFELLGHAGAPLALFYIGGSLAGLALSGNRAVAAQIVAIKLIVHPAIVALALAGYRLAGGVLAPELAGALLLTAAAPMLGTYAVFAAEKGHQGMASIALLGATVAAFFTNSALLALLV